MSKIYIAFFFSRTEERSNATKMIRMTYLPIIPPNINKQERLRVIREIHVIKRLHQVVCGHLWAFGSRSWECIPPVSCLGVLWFGHIAIVVLFLFSLSVDGQCGIEVYNFLSSRVYVVAFIRQNFKSKPSGDSKLMTRQSGGKQRNLDCDSLSTENSVNVFILQLQLSIRIADSSQHD